VHVHGHGGGIPSALGAIERGVCLQGSIRSYHLSRSIIQAVVVPKCFDKQVASAAPRCQDKAGQGYIKQPQDATNSNFIFDEVSTLSKTLINQEMKLIFPLLNSLS
jgi:hypothetical protein